MNGDWTKDALARTPHRSAPEARFVVLAAGTPRNNRRVRTLMNGIWVVLRQLGAGSSSRR